MKPLLQDHRKASGAVCIPSLLYTFWKQDAKVEEQEEIRDDDVALHAPPASEEESMGKYWRPF